MTLTFLFVIFIHSVLSKSPFFHINYRPLYSLITKNCVGSQQAMNSHKISTFTATIQFQLQKNVENVKNYLFQTRINSQRNLQKYLASESWELFFMIYYYCWSRKAKIVVCWDSKFMTKLEKNKLVFISIPYSHFEGVKAFTQRHSDLIN